MLDALRRSHEFCDVINKLEEGTEMHVWDMAQPAIFLYSMCDFHERFNGRDSRCKFMGHSVGEYAALCAAGVLSLHDGLQLVLKRSQIMHDSVKGGGPGAMYALIGKDVMHKLTP